MPKKQEPAKKDLWLKSNQWDFYSGLPNPSWYDESDDQTESDEG